MASITPTNDGPPLDRKFQGERPKIKKIDPTSAAVIPTFSQLKENDQVTSTPIIDRILTDRTIVETRGDLKSLDGYSWNCIGLKESRGNRTDRLIGYYYNFLLKEIDGEQRNKISEKTFPAIEPDFNRVNQYFTSHEFPIKVENFNVFSILGFKFENNILSIPDIEIINQKKKVFGEDFAKRMKLVKTTKEISNKEFIESAIRGELIISEGPHMIHDIVFHLFTHVLRLLNDPDRIDQTMFEEFLKKHLNAIEKKREKSINLPETEKKEINEKLNFLEFYLAASTDTLLAYDSFKARLVSILDKYPLPKNLWKDNIIEKEFPAFLKMTDEEVMQDFKNLIEESLS